MPNNIFETLRLIKLGEEVDQLIIQREGLDARHAVEGGDVERTGDRGDAAGEAHHAVTVAGNTARQLRHGEQIVHVLGAQLVVAQ